MLKNKNIICISSIDWDFVWQGHQEIMATLARNGNRVLFIENTGVRAPNFKDIKRLKKRIINWYRSIKGFRMERENLYIYSPVILPFPYSKLARWLNKKIMLKPIAEWIRVMEFHNPIVWTFLPTGTALDIINNIDGKLLIYYCIADFYELTGNPKKVKKTEDELIRKSDLIFAQGQVLYDKCRRLNDNVSIFPFGVKMEVFENFRSNSGKVPSDIKDIKAPVIGYLGGVHKHIDFGLLKFIARSHPEWSILLVGPIQTDTGEIKNFQNVFLIGKKDFSELPYYINKFDICVIPYRKSKYTETVYPTKLNEYHALGKPVVSTDLPEVINFNKYNDNLIFVSKTHREFTDNIIKALDDSDGILSQRRIASAKKNSWSSRIEEMSSLIEEAIERKSRMPLDWKNNFLKLYRKVHRKTFKVCVSLMSIYLLIFYTPLLWFLAYPLKVSGLPQKADCIVVFAGGVGESGKAGQGYEERVGYAVDLYKNGYAKHLVFSSGYAYVFTETLVMKALAVSLGVPEQMIILEDKAINTYENVKFTKKILDSMGWQSILLISSPYHMLRAKLVFSKVVPEIKVIYLPINNSRFYSHGFDGRGRKIWRQVSLKQIKSILHEYLAVLYYWWKGYL